MVLVVIATVMLIKSHKPEGGAIRTDEPTVIDGASASQALGPSQGPAAHRVVIEINEDVNQHSGQESLDDELFVWCVDEDGQPCANVACVVDLVGGPVRQKRLTDELGVLVLERALCPLGHVVVKDSRYATKVLKFGEQVSGQYLLRLRGNVSITGRVVFPDGRSVRGGQVFAFPSVRTYSAEFVKNRNFTPLSTPDFSATVDDSGTFEMSGLAKGAWYEFVALGPSYATPEGGSRFVLQAPSKAVTVPVAYFYGAVVMVTDENGDGVNLEGALRRSYDDNWLSTAGPISLIEVARDQIKYDEVPAPDVSPVVSDFITGSLPPIPTVNELVPGLSWGAVLTKFNTPYLEHDNAHLILLTSTEYLHEVKAELKLKELHGYDSFRTPVHIPLITEQELSVVQIELKSRPRSMGALSLELDNAVLSDKDLALPDWPFLEVVLSNPDAAALDLKYILTRDDFPKWQIPNVPCGEYKLTVKSLEGNWSCDGGSIGVESLPVVSSVRVSAATAGSVCVTLVDEDGQAYGGPASLVLMKKTFSESSGRETLHTRGSFTQVFLRPPYAFHFVEPGDWEVFLATPTIAIEQVGDRTLPVHVRAGQCADCRLVVVDR